MTKDKNEHVSFQRDYFNKNVDFFKRPIPEDVINRSREITRSLITAKDIRLLDVGTGIGAFLIYYHELGLPYTNIVGCDLSAEMLGEAQRRFPEVSFWNGDILELPESFGKFDLIVFNACFGNIFDQLSVLKRSRDLLNKGGRIAISHPMGNDFVGQLKEAEPDLIFSLLPSRETLEKWCSELKMTITLFRDEPMLYLAVISN